MWLWHWAQCMVRPRKAAAVVLTTGGLSNSGQEFTGNTRLLLNAIDKFDGGVGFPTFTKPISKDSLAESLDTSHDMQRTEVHAKRSNAHLGYVFPDPKSPTGQRYVVYSAAFHFVPVEEMKDRGYEAYVSLLEKKLATP